MGTFPKPTIVIGVCQRREKLLEFLQNASEISFSSMPIWLTIL